MAKFVVEFSPPEKIKSEPHDVTDSIVNYRMVLAPFQKQTQVEFTNIKLKEISVRFLTVVNPLGKPGHYVLPPPSDGVYFDVYKFTLEPNSQCEITITWRPSEYGNMRKLIKIEQVDNNRKYDFVILGNCNGPPYKKFKGASSTYSKSKNSDLIKPPLNCNQKIILPNKTKTVSYTTEKISSEKNPVKISEEPISIKSLQLPIRRQTYLIREKENFPVGKNNLLGRNTILTSPERSVKRPDQKRQDYVFNNHFNFKNLNNSSSPLSDDSLEKPLMKIVSNNLQFNEFCLTPLKSTENLISPFSDKSLCNSFNDQLNVDVTDGVFESVSSNSSHFKSEDSITAAVSHTPIDIRSDKLSVSLCNTFIKTPEDELKNEGCSNFKLDAVKIELLNSPYFEPEVEQHSNSRQKLITWSGMKLKRPSFAIKNSPYYKCSPKTSMKSKSKQCSTSLRTTHPRVPKQDMCDQYFRSLTNPELLYHNNAEDPFLKMSEYYETEWLNRQESDMIRWLNTLLTPTDKLVDKEQSGDLERAAMAWIEASKTCHQNKPMQFATEKDLFVAQIYRQSPQEWSALRKATKNLIMSTSVSSVLSKLTVTIEKDLINIRDDRQIHLDLSLKKKVIDLFKCYNPLWFRIGLEAIYGQIIHVKPGSNDLDGIGWFVRKNLFNNDFVKHKFTKSTVLQMNSPSYNIAMKKFILRKILMLIYFLDRAKEQQLIRHDPCLFKNDSLYKSSYDLLMGFCADMVIAHGDIVRRFRSVGYNLTHKQTHLDEINYAVKSLNDLRDGTRITKVVEILFKGNPLSQKLRLPAISKLQKIHNVNLAFTRISEHISIEGNIATRDIVNGHREKILSLFWQIIYKYLTPRYNDAATKIQNWWRNSSLKLVILKRIRVKQIAKRHLAATKIQAHIRGKLTRKRWPCTRAKLIENRKMLHAASTKIKHYLKDKLKLLTDERKRFIILRRTVVFVQRKFRTKMVMIKERQKYLLAKSSAIIIQKNIRGFILRKKWFQIKNDLMVEKTKRIAAVNIIKRTLRRNLPSTLDRVEFLKLKQTALYIENLYLANKSMEFQMECYTKLRNMTMFLQRKFKANIAMHRERTNYLNIKRSALLIQKIFRGFIVRKYWADTQNRLLLENKKRIDAINMVKRALRRNLPETQDRLNFFKLKHTVLYIQRLYVANRLMKFQLNYYTSLKNATMCIQRKYKANVAMKNERKNYLNTKRSVLLIQKTFRGFSVRKNWPYTRNHLLMEMRKRVNAVNTVKRALRRSLPETHDRAAFVELKSSVLCIQRLWRANLLTKTQREQYILLRRVTVFVQQKFRAKVMMRTYCQNYLMVKQSTLLIQKVYRGYAAKKNWPNVRIRLIAEQTKRTQAVDIIKRVLRANLPTTPDRLYYEKLRRSTMTVQRRYQAIVTMRAQMAEYGKLKRSAIVVQRRFRAKRAMEMERRRYSTLRTCVVRLQCAARGYLFRQSVWPTLKTELTNRRWYLIRCVDTIKRTLRRRLANSDRQWFLELRCAAITVQRAFRAHRQAQEYQELQAAASKIQAGVRGFLVRKRIPKLKDRLRAERQAYASTSIQAFWRGYCVRKKYQCRRETVRLPRNGAQTLAKRHNDVLNVLNKQKKNDYSYKELSTVYWNLDTCTSLSKELCVKTVEGNIVNCIFHFLQYSNQSQPSVEAREPAVRVLTNLLRYHETSQTVWKKVVSADMVKELIKMMKTSCGKFGATNKLYCSIATWIWIALQDPEKKRYIKRIPVAIVDFRYMLDTLNRRYKTPKLDKKLMVLPSTRPTWFIGSKCQKCFESDLYATTQVCKMLNIVK